MERLRKFLGLSGRRRSLLIEAGLYLTTARIAVALLPFRRLTPQLGTHMAETTRQPTPQQARMARDIAWAIGAAERHLPLKTVCLHQAIAAKRMLTHHAIPATFFLGARKGADQHFEAHAWVRSDGITVAGGPSNDDYTVVSTFS